MNEKRKMTDSVNKKASTAKTKDTEIYQSIYDAIVDHRLAPGSKLPEDSLAETFGVSRTVIRKVLLNLTHGGVVTSTPNRGSRVAHPTAKEGKEVFVSRRLVETAAIPLIIEKLTESQLDDLKQIDEAQKSAQAGFDHHNAIRLSGQFHEAMMAVTDNKILIEFVRNLISQSSLIVAVYGSSEPQTSSCQGHTELLALMEAGDVTESQQWMETHLKDVESTLEFSPEKADVISFSKVFF